MSTTYLFRTTKLALMAAALFVGSQIRLNTADASLYRKSGMMPMSQIIVCLYTGSAIRPPCSRPVNITRCRKAT